MSHWSGSDDFFSSAEREMFPKLQDSRMALSLISGAPDAKSCLELGAAIMFDKPIVVVSFGDVEVPERLLELAHAHVHYEEDEPILNGPGAEKLIAAMSGIIEQ